MQKTACLEGFIYVLGVQYKAHLNLGVCVDVGAISCLI